MLNLVGIGVGPFNLSLAALLTPLKHINYCFFDVKPEFSWHGDLLLDYAEIQTNYLQDLVTPVDPTNPYSFIAYLVKHKRFNRFLYANFDLVLRKEFHMYLQWASQHMANLHFGEKIETIHFRAKAFEIQTTKRIVTAKNLVLGSGLSPNVPAAARPFLNKQVFHNEDFLKHPISCKDKRVVVIGGGQGGAEMIKYLLANSSELPRQLNWITRRDQLQPLDISPFANEYFTSTYVKHFYQLPAAVRQRLLQQQKLASDGITPHLLDEIYQRLYVLEFIEQKFMQANFYLQHEFITIRKDPSAYVLQVKELHTSLTKCLKADVMIFCTGYRWEFPSYLATLQPQIPLQNKRFIVNADYSIAWNGPASNRIYVQNNAQHTHGIADPNLCLMAWRSAVIINSLTHSRVYDIDDDSTAIDWHNQFGTEFKSREVAYAC